MSPNLRFYGTTTVLSKEQLYTVKVILLSWLFGRNTCKVVPWRYNKTRINCNGLLNLSNELEKKNLIFSYAMVNLGILKLTFNCFLTYKAILTRPPVSCIATHQAHVDVNVLDTSDTFFHVNDLIKDKWKKLMIMKKI